MPTGTLIGRHAARSSHPAPVTTSRARRLAVDDDRAPGRHGPGHVRIDVAARPRPPGRAAGTAIAITGGTVTVRARRAARVPRPIRPRSRRPRTSPWSRRTRRSPARSRSAPTTRSSTRPSISIPTTSSVRLTPNGFTVSSLRSHAEPAGGRQPPRCGGGRRHRRSRRPVRRDRPVDHGRAVAAARRDRRRVAHGVRHRAPDPRASAPRARCTAARATRVGRRRARSTSRRLEKHDRCSIELLHAGAWLDAFGLFGELDGERGEAEVDTLLGGGTLGVDAWLGERFVVGLAAGYARIDLDARRPRRADVYGDTIQGALYAGFVGPARLSSRPTAAMRTRFQDSTRRIDVAGPARTARTRAGTPRTTARAARPASRSSRSAASRSSRSRAIDWLRLDEESYRERGAGTLGLDRRSRDAREHDRALRRTPVRTRRMSDRASSCPSCARSGSTCTATASASSTRGSRRARAHARSACAARSFRARVLILGVGLGRAGRARTSPCRSTTTRCSAPTASSTRGTSRRAGCSEPDAVDRPRSHP